MDQKIKVIDTIQIGGIEHEVFLSFRHANSILKNFFRLVNKHQATEITEIPPQFFIDSIWIILRKKGFWKFKKPFRNKAGLYKAIHKDEFIEIMNFVGARILDMNKAVTEDKPEKTGDRKPGNPKRSAG